MKAAGALVVIVALMAVAGSAVGAEMSAHACVPARVYAASTPPTPGGPTGVRWMRAGRTVGYLFAYGEALRRLSPGRAALFTGGVGKAGEAMKILWAVRGGRSVVSVIGDRLDSPGTFAQSFRSVGVGASVDWVYYASVLDIPAAGCWRLTIGSPGTRGRFALLAVEE